MNTVTVAIPLTVPGKVALQWLTRQPARTLTGNQDLGVVISALLTMIGRALDEPADGDEEHPLADLLSHRGFNNELDHPVGAALVPGAPIARTFVVTADQSLDSKALTAQWQIGMYVVEVGTGVVWQLTEAPGTLLVKMLPPLAVDEYGLHIHEQHPAQEGVQYVRVIELFDELV